MGRARFFKDSNYTGFIEITRFDDLRFYGYSWFLDFKIDNREKFWFRDYHSLQTFSADTYIEKCAAFLRTVNWLNYDINRIELLFRGEVE